MNYRTTLLLAFTLVVLVLLWYVVQSRPPADQAALRPPSSPTASAQRDLIEEDIGEVVKITVETRDGQRWVFEVQDGEAGAPAEWYLTEPARYKCVRWEVEKFANQLTGLTYELSYREGDPGAVTADEAGLAPPFATITLVNEDGDAVAVEIGRAAGNRQTYVRLADSDVIAVGRADLRGLIKDKPLDYRDKQPWAFEAGNVTRVEIEDRADADAPVQYLLVRDGGRWMFAAPVSARATDKVNDMLTTMGRLRVTKWVDDRPGSLGGYGLDPAALTVRATVEQEVEADESNAENGDETPAETKTVTETTVYTLHLADRSPIGEETQVYVRPGDEPAVGTITRTNADKFRVDMSEWRDMRVTTADVHAATRVDVTVGTGRASLVREGDTWRFEADGGEAEASAVTELLGAIAGLTAVAFVDDPSAVPAEYGFDDPRAEIRLQIPGVEGGERIITGDYTDQTARRLVYVGRGSGGSVAKVRTADVETLLRPPTVYRDRVVIEVLPSRYERIAISRHNPYADRTETVTLVRDEGNWRMIEPVEAAVREDRVDPLVETLGGLRAEQVVAEATEASAYGLHDPDVRLSITYRPPAETRIEETPEEGEPPQRVEVQPPPQVIELAVTTHDGAHYARRGDRGTIYRMSPDFYAGLHTELRDDRVMPFEAGEVTGFTLRREGTTHTFERRDDAWVYVPEPDLPLDSSKVENLLLQLRDLRAIRYVAQLDAEPAAAGESTDAAEDDLGTARFGLASPAQEAGVTLEDGRTLVLLLGGEAHGGPEPGIYATLRGTGEVFLLPADTLRRLTVSLAELEATP